MCSINYAPLCVFNCRLSDESGKMEFNKVHEGSFPKSKFDTKDGTSII